MGYNKETKISFKFQVLSFKVLFLCLLIFLPLVASAAVLYLEPSSGDYHRGDTFLVEIRLDTEGEYINTVESNLSFSSEILEVQDLSQGNSILSLRAKEPNVSNNIISFIGGTPGGYQGKDGLLGRIAFRAKHETDAKLERETEAKLKFLEGTKVLLNDGKGTEAKLITKEANFNILAEKLEIPEDAWKKELEKDKILPEPFKIELVHNPAIFDGKYFIIFSTTDKQAGIDHYEVKEGKEKWQVATSPYVLENQKLTRDIMVKAIDKAGNYWMETLEVQNKKVEWEIYVVLGLVLVLVIIILGVIRRKIKLKPR